MRRGHQVSAARATPQFPAQRAMWCFYREELQSQKLALLMGTHPAAGAVSPVRSLYRDVLTLVLEFCTPRRVLVVGGYRQVPIPRMVGPQNAVHTCEVLDPMSGQWDYVAPMLVPRSGAALLSLPKRLGGGALAIGGSVYNPLLNTWKPRLLSSCEVFHWEPNEDGKPRHELRKAALQGSAEELLEPDAKYTTPPFKSERASVPEERVVPMEPIPRDHPAASAPGYWSLFPPMLQAREGCGAVIDGDSLWVFGGRAYGKGPPARTRERAAASASVERFDFQSRRWSTAAPLPRAADWVIGRAEQARASASSALSVALCLCRCEL